MDFDGERKCRLFRWMGEKAIRPKRNLIPRGSAIALVALEIRINIFFPPSLESVSLQPKPVGTVVINKIQQ